jgi:hypothetical protein
MRLNAWDDEGDTERTEYWRTIVPALSTSPGDDLTGVTNTHERVAAVRQRYVLELKHLARSGSVTAVRTGLTRIADWSALDEVERLHGRPGSPFALCRGVPSGRSDAVRAEAEALDFALLVSLPPAFLPGGLLVLEGVPLVVARGGAQPALAVQHGGSLAYRAARYELSVLRWTPMSRVG